MGRHAVGGVDWVHSRDTEYYYCWGCCSVGSWCLYEQCSCLLVVVGIGGVVVGIVDFVRGVVAFACVGESVCSMLCWGVVGEGVGFVVVSVGWLD